MSTPLYQVDAFADAPFTGNPAAVCVLEVWRADDILQAIAQEMNLSETAFVVARGRDFAAPEGVALRWFTPACEVDLCGHATLAAAHTLWESARVPASRSICFHTRSGELRCARAAGDAGEATVLDFPADPPRPLDPPAGLLAALGQPIVRGSFSSAVAHLLVLEDAAAVRDAAPDFGALARVDVGAVAITARGAGDGADFVSRFFAPRYGIDEDPVTGSLHCALAPLWAERLGRERLLARQLSARGGQLVVALRGDRVRIEGRAVTVARGELLV